jgi:putative ABC transport system ATP-binding protein
MKKILQTIDLKMTYQLGKVGVNALRGVNLEVGEGEYVAIMGPSGCGKSTMLHIIGGMLRPTEGRVIIDGEDMTNMSDAARTEVRRRKIGFVFQKFNLFPTLTAEGNIRLAERIRSNGHRFDDPKRRSEILRLLKLDGRLNHKPIEMSGGEQQRVAIARALICNPSIILADEPTGNLDSENSEIVLRMLKQLNMDFGQTIVMITHNSEAAAVAQRIVYMRDGQIVK